MLHDVGFCRRKGFRFPTLDEGLSAVGVGAALSSAVFAAYMLSRGSSDPTFAGAEHLNLFAQPVRHGRGPEPEDRVIGNSRGVDFNSTGSIRHGGTRLEAGGGKQAPVGTRVAIGDAADHEALIGGYVVRFVHDGLAIVQGAKGAYAVKPGAFLPDAGRVLSIQKRGIQWVVVTAKGLIAEPAW